MIVLIFFIHNQYRLKTANKRGGICIRSANFLNSRESNSILMMRQITVIFAIVLSISALSCSIEDKAENKTIKQDENGMVLVPKADFMMGGNDELKREDELPRHRVLLDPFWMDQTESSQCTV